MRGGETLLLFAGLGKWFGVISLNFVGVADFSGAWVEIQRGGFRDSPQNVFRSRSNLMQA